MSCNIRIPLQQIIDDVAAALSDGFIKTDNAVLTEAVLNEVTIRGDISVDTAARNALCAILQTCGITAIELEWLDRPTVADMVAVSEVVAGEVVVSWKDLDTLITEGIVGKVQTTDVLDSLGVSQEEINTDIRNELDALPFEGGVLSDTFVTVEEQVTGDGVLSLRDFNSRSIFTVSDITELLRVKPTNGRTVKVQGLQGGTFIYDSTKSAINDGGTVFDGWVRQFTGSVFLEWFCTSNPATNDCSVFLENAFKVSNSVKCGSGTFKFTGRVGLPDQPTVVARKKIKLTGDGDTVFDMSGYDNEYGCFTSTAGKANPTSGDNLFTAVIDISGINFAGDDSKTCHLIDGDRLYNIFLTHNNFTKLKSIIKSKVSLPVSQGGIPYTQTIFMTHNNIGQNESIIDAHELVNIVFDYNQCEGNGNGIYCESARPDGSAIAVGRFNFNLFEGGGQFLHAGGDVHALTFIGNYLEYNIYGRVLTEKCQVNITGQCIGFVEMGNAYAGQSDAILTSGYVDVRIDNTVHNIGTERAMPVSIGNVSNALQHNSVGKMLALGNAALSTTATHLGGKNLTQAFATRNMRSAQESGVSVLDTRLAYYLDANVVNTGMELLVGVVDLSEMVGIFKNNMSMCSYDVSMNLDMMNTGLSVGMASISLKLTVFAPTVGPVDADIPTKLHMAGKLVDLQQAGGWNMNTTNPDSIMKEQFGAEPELIINSIAGNKYELRISNYLQQIVIPNGYPNLFVNSITSTAYTHNRDSNNVVGANLRFIEPVAV